MDMISVLPELSISGDGIRGLVRTRSTISSVVGSGMAQCSPLLASGGLVRGVISPG